MGDASGGWKTGKVIATYMGACGHAGPVGWPGIEVVWHFSLLGGVGGLEGVDADGRFLLGIGLRDRVDFVKGQQLKARRAQWCPSRRQRFCWVLASFRGHGNPQHFSPYWGHRNACLLSERKDLIIEVR